MTPTRGPSQGSKFDRRERGGIIRTSWLGICTKIEIEQPLPCAVFQVWTLRKVCSNGFPFDCLWLLFRGPLNWRQILELGFGLSPNSFLRRRVLSKLHQMGKIHLRPA